MLRYCILFSALLLCSPALGQTISPYSSVSSKAERPAHTPVIAIADFTGDDAATGRFLADTLLTDLAQSRDMRLVERNELRRAIAEQKRQDTELYEPQAIQAIGRMVRADKLLVGSFLIRENQIIINARLLDIATGRVSEGSASNIMGDTYSLLSAVHRLAHILHRHITGNELILNGEGADPSSLPDARASRSAGPTTPQNGYRIGADSVTERSAEHEVAPARSVHEKSYRIRESSTDGGSTIIYNMPIYNPPIYYTPPIVPTYTPPYYPSYPLYYSLSYWTYPYTRFRGYGRNYSGLQFNIKARLNINAHRNHIRVRW